MTLKTYLNNSYLKEINAKILEKSFKDDKYYFKLDRTIFYPHLAGGQPKDLGTINGVEVIDVFENGSDIVHVLEEDIEYEDVHLSIDWDNRFDLMQQHTGQHLLSSSFTSLFNAPTVGFHLGEEYTTIDIQKPSLNKYEVEQIEYLTNKVIQSNFPILSYIIDKEKLDKIPIRKLPPTNKNIRIVEIMGLDYSPCCGTHVSSTGEVGLVKIRKWENNKDNIRVEFLCGHRALEDYNWKNQYIRKLAAVISSKDKDIVDKYEKILEDKLSLEKENRKLREDLYKYIGESFLQQTTNYKDIKYIIKEVTDMNLKEISSIASYLSSKEKLIQIYSIPGETDGQFLISRSQDLNINLRNLFNNISQDIEVKGGGSSRTIQGGASIEVLNDFILEFYNQTRNNYKG